MLNCKAVNGFAQVKEGGHVEGLGYDYADLNEDPVISEPF